MKRRRKKKIFRKHCLKKAFFITLFMEMTKVNNSSMAMSTIMNIRNAYVNCTGNKMTMSSHHHDELFSKELLRLANFTKKQQEAFKSFFVFQKNFFSRTVFYWSLGALFPIIVRLLTSQSYESSVTSLLTL
jgi:hypothetical protein